MKNKILLIIVVFLIPIVVISFIKKETNFLLPSNEEFIKIDNLKEPLEEYIIGVVAAEMPASFKDEALKAQAVAARSYVIYDLRNHNGKNIKLDSSFQAYITIEEMKNKWGLEFDKYYKKVKDVVFATSGEIMTYKNEVIKAFYFAQSNGYTENALTVFNEDKPYLKGVISMDNTNNTKEKTITIADFCFLLDLDDCQKISISNIIKTENGRVNKITINKRTFTGTQIRKKLDLRSNDFTIKIEDKVKITMVGYGHGVGMSQRGAQEMAKTGSTYIEILKHYYQDIEIKDYRV